MLLQEKCIERFKDQSSFVRSRAMKLFCDHMVSFGLTWVNVNPHENERFLSAAQVQEEYQTWLKKCDGVVG